LVTLSTGLTRLKKLTNKLFFQIRQKLLSAAKKREANLHVRIIQSVLREPVREFADQDVWRSFLEIRDFNPNQHFRHQRALDIFKKWKCALEYSFRAKIVPFLNLFLSTG
jgi:hypothetical protein